MSETVPDYHPFYCEENIWRLNRRFLRRGARHEVVFITSLAGATPLFGMRAAPSVNEPIFWDYHVILVERGEGETRIWDLDSVHGAPLLAIQWFELSMPNTQALPDPYRSLFRVVDGESFDANFSSDRSHMRDESGNYLKSPPPWPAPFKPTLGMMLTNYQSAQEGGPGRLLSANDFFRHIS